MSPSRRQPAALWWVRHAESEGNVADLSARRASAARLTLPARDPDVVLSAQGQRQAMALGRAWAGLTADERPSAVLTSPYVRAHDTAQAALRASGWPLVPQRDERLRERDLGLLDGYTSAGIREQFPDEARRRDWLGKFYYRPPGGESWADVAGRVRSLLLDLSMDHPDETVVLVTHQAVILVARYVLEDLTEQEVLAVDRSARLANTGVTRHRWSADGWRLAEHGDERHLDEPDLRVTDEGEPA